MGEFLVLLQICGLLYIRDIWCSSYPLKRKFGIIFMGVLPALIYISIYIKPLTKSDFSTRVDWIFNERGNFSLEKQ
jgi:hypothetical protein